MTELSERSRCVLRTLIAAPIAWLAPSHLAAKIGGDREKTLDALAELDSAGWLDPWEIDGDLFVTLTTYAAERLGVRLAPGGRSDTMRWVPISEPEPSPRTPGRGQGDVDALDLIPDPSPGPEAAVEAAERADRLVSRPTSGADPISISSLPRPAILLGSGLTPWPGPEESRGPVCPGCKSQPIPEKAYCLVCDRWGLDPMLAAANGQAAPTRRTARPTPNCRPCAGDRCGAKLARKEKHRRKMEKQIEVDRAKKKETPRPSPASVRPGEASSV